jgi:hypothetical protein
LNPTKTGGGAYPFRTGISAYKLTSFEIMSKCNFEPVSILSIIRKAEIA